MGYDGDLGRPNRTFKPQSSCEPSDDNLRKASDSPVAVAGPVDDPERAGARPGDNMIDRPKSIAVDMKSAEPNEKQTVSSTDVELSDLLNNPKLSPPAFLKSSAWVLTLTFIVAAILLVVSSHAIRFLRDLMALPEWLKWTGFVLLTVLVGLIAFTLIRAILFFIRLSSSPQLDLNQLKLKTAISSWDNKPYRIAKEEFLVSYLRSLQNRDLDIKKKFYSMAEDDSILQSVEALLKTDRNISSREWVDEFMDRVQKPMDQMARKRIDRAAKAVAIKTAISPWSFVDMASVIYNSVQMISDLSVIYNRRLGRGESVRIFVNLFTSIYIAGEAQQAIGEQLDKSFPVEVGDAEVAEDFVPEMLFKSFGSVAGRVARISAKKAAEGATNWFLMKRLGRRVESLFKPIVD